MDMIFVYIYICVCVCVFIMNDAKPYNACSIPIMPLKHGGMYTVDKDEMVLINKRKQPLPPFKKTTMHTMDVWEKVLSYISPIKL